VDDLRPDYKKINRRFAWLTIAIIVGLTFVVVTSLYVGKTVAETQSIVSIAAWFVAAPFAVGYMGSLTTRMEKKTDMSVRMFDKLYEEIHPTVENAKKVLESLSGLVDQVKRQEPGRIIEFVDKLQKSGTIDKVAKSLEQIAGRVRGALETSSDLLDKL
jgi:hypothetical protein